MLRRRRAPRVVWLPTNNANELAAGLNIHEVFFTYPGGEPKGAEIVNAFPLTFDQPRGVGATDSLSDTENSGYRLRRLVGKIYVAAAQANQQDAGAWICTAGFIVLRVDPAGNPLQVPSPAVQIDIADPWIWRRTWIVANGQSGNLAGNLVDTANFSNFEGGPSAVDGPHVDQKTARVISQEERLFLVLSTVGAEASAIGATQDLEWLWDLRVLATMRTTSGNRRNASR